MRAKARAKQVAPKRVAAYTHPPLAPVEQAPDAAPGNYYVSIRDGGRYGLLAGPFRNDHAGALAMVDRARAVAHEVNYREAVWASFGTCRMPGDFDRPGCLNDRLGLPTKVER